MTLFLCVTLTIYTLQEAAWTTVDECIQLFGGMGYMTVSKQVTLGGGSGS